MTYFTNSLTLGLMLQKRNSNQAVFASTSLAFKYLHLIRVMNYKGIPLTPKWTRLNAD